MKEKILPLPMTLEETRAYQWALSQQFGSVSATYARILAEYIEKVSRVQPELFAEIEQLKAANAAMTEALEALVAEDEAMRLQGAPMLPGLRPELDEGMEG